MDFIFNSKAKKVEIFYDSEAEQQALLNFLNQNMAFKPSKDFTNINENNDGWKTVMQPPFTIDCGSYPIELSTHTIVKSEQGVDALDFCSEEGGFTTV